MFDYSPETGDIWRKVSGYRGKSIGHVERDGYRRVGFNYKKFKASRLIWCWMTGEDPGPLEIDHKDKDRDNNRWENLRLSTSSQNNSNKKRRSSKNRYMGVSKGNKNSWRAIGKMNGKSIHLGTFLTQEEAAHAYDRHAIKVYGEFARLNFPDT